MNASAVFVHPGHPRVALKATERDFFVIETARHADVRMEDQIAGDLTMSSIKWCFNITRERLIHVKVLGRFPTLALAVRATSLRVAR